MNEIREERKRDDLDDLYVGVSFMRCISRLRVFMARHLVGIDSMDGYSRSFWIIRSIFEDVVIRVINLNLLTVLKMCLCFLVYK